MTAFELWMILGLCTGYVPGDEELTYRLCEAQFEAKMRDIVPDNPLPDSPKLTTKVASVCWPKSAC